MSDRDEIPRYLENWQDEVDSAAEYRAMAAAEPIPGLPRSYPNLAAMEERTSRSGRTRLREPARRSRPRRPSWRSRVLEAIARRLGPDLVLPPSQRRRRRTRTTTSSSRRPPALACRPRSDWHAKVLEAAPHEPAAWRPGQLPGAPRRPAPLSRRQRAARGGAGRQRRAVLEPQPRHGCGRRLGRQPRPARHRAWRDSWPAPARWPWASGCR